MLGVISSERTEACEKTSQQRVSEIPVVSDRDSMQRTAPTQNIDVGMKHRPSSRSWLISKHRLLKQMLRDPSLSINGGYGDQRNNMISRQYSIRTPRKGQVTPQRLLDKRGNNTMISIIPSGRGAAVEEGWIA
jgi:hypothetical protein